MLARIGRGPRRGRTGGRAGHGRGPDGVSRPAVDGHRAPHPARGRWQPGRGAGRHRGDRASPSVVAIRIQREVGCTLAEVLAGTVETMRDRASLYRHVRALSAEGKLSAYILVALPLGVGGWQIG